jgi:hypothetical protein
VLIAFVAAAVLQEPPKQPVEFDQAINYVNKIKVRLAAAQQHLGGVCATTTAAARRQQQQQTQRQAGGVAQGGARRCSRRACSAQGHQAVLHAHLLSACGRCGQAGALQVLTSPMLRADS